MESNIKFDRVVNINKPKGMTSHDVVYKVRKIFNTKKVGHTGTLDPDATGVLPICIGRATKLSDIILNKDKKYICEMTIGIETDTYDSSGTILNEADTSRITEDDVIKALKTQTGIIDQYPPIYSALKVNGKKMCDIVRSGNADSIVIKSRKVEIFEITVLDIHLPRVRFEVHCSKGTYIRSICHDVGKILGVGAHMSDLIRTKSGIFKIEDSITLEELHKYFEDKEVFEHSYSVEETLSEFPFLKLKDNAVKYYSNGGKIEMNRFIEFDFDPNSVREFLFDSSKCQNCDKIYRVRVYSNENEFIGIGKLHLENDTLTVKSEKIFNIG